MRYKLEDCAGSRLRKLSRIVDNNIRDFLKDFNITESQLTILFALYETKEIGQGELGKELALERSTVSRNINLLVKAGFVNKTEDYRPGIRINPRGRKLVEDIIPHWERTTDALVKKLGEEGLKALNLLEERIN